MPDALIWLTSWGCIGFGVLFLLHAVRLRRAERQQRQRPIYRWSLSWRELLWEGPAVVLLGAANLLGGHWVWLTCPAMVVALVLAIRVSLRWNGLSKPPPRA